MICGTLWRFRLVDGRFSFYDWLGAQFRRPALRLVCADPTRRTLWLQHHHAEDLVAGSREGPAARPGPGAAVARACFETRRLGRLLVVALGLGRCARLSNGHAGARPNPD